jgi:hypothetical protein
MNKQKHTMKYLILSLTVAAFFGSCQPHAHEGEEASEEHAGHEAHGEHDHPAAPEGLVIQEVNDGQHVFFANLTDGQIVTSPLAVEFGVQGMEVVPAGAVEENKGHHHLLIDHDFTPAGEVVPPADSTQLHFGKGQLSTTINLAPGKHKLTLQFANGVHMSYGEKMSTSITVSVEAAAKHMGDKK